MSTTRSIWRTSVRELGGRLISGIRQRVRAWFDPEVAPMRPSRSEPSGTGSGKRVRERTLDMPPGAYWDGYRSTSWRQRDLSPVNHDLMITGVQWLYGSSPIARRALEIQRDFVVAEGFEIKPATKNEAWAERIQSVIDKHWKDPVNAWEERLGQRVLELAMFGEWTMHAVVRRRDGRVRLGMMIPELISKIEANPLNAEELREIVLKGAVPVRDPETGQMVEQERFRIIHLVEDPHDDNYDLLDGEVFHCAINRLSTASRGLSDLLPIIDWLDLFHQLLHSEVDRAMMLKAFVWDVSYDDAQSGEIDECIERNQEPPMPGSVNIHSAKEKWQALTPDLKLADIMVLLKFILLLCLGAIGIPEHWFVEANTVNKASAGEMDDPVWARVRERQNVVMGFLRRIFQFAVERAWNAGVLAGIPRSELGVDVHTIDPDRKQYETLGQALNFIADFLGKGRQQNWIDDTMAAKAYRQLCGLVGFEFEDLPQEAPQAPTQLDVARQQMQQHLAAKQAAFTQAAA